MTYYFNEFFRKWMELRRIKNRTSIVDYGTMINYQKYKKRGGWKR